MKIDRKKLIQAVQAGRRGMGIDDETYRAKLQMQFGKTSTKDLTDQELLDLRHELNTGNGPTGGRRSKFRKAAPRADQRFVYALWRELRDLGGVKVKGRAGLQAFLNSRYGKDRPEFMDQQETYKAAEALKAMIVRVRRGEAIKPEEIEAAA